jgi:hypothetical protein
MLTFYLPLGEGSNWDNNELRYMLRSLEENVICDFEVYIYATCVPKWLQNVHIIQLDRFYPDWLKEKNEKLDYENYFDTLNKLNKFVFSDSCPDEFVYITDDTILLQEIISIVDIHNYPLELELPNFKKLRNIKHGKTINRAMELSNNKNALNYDTHFPRRFDRENLREMFLMHDFMAHDVPYSFATLYSNLFITDIVPLSKRNDYGAGFYFNRVGCTASYPSTSLKIINKAVRDKMWVSYNDNGLNWEGENGVSWLKHFIEARFPNKSRFEV